MSNGTLGNTKCAVLGVGCVCVCVCVEGGGLDSMRRNNGTLEDFGNVPNYSSHCTNGGN